MKNFILYSDGACSGNPGPGGWASIVYDPIKKIVQERGGAENPSTNNRMEITGVLEGLRAVVQSLDAEAKTGNTDRIESLKTSSAVKAKSKDAQGDLFSETDASTHAKVEKVVKVDVYTDSTYVIYGATQWMKGWKSRGWKNAKMEPVQNPDLWEAMDNVLAKLRSLKWISINWHYVPGHEGIDGNERCDEIAVGFSKDGFVDLYKGKPESYSFDIFEPPPPHPLPEMRFGAPSAESKADNFYLSSVGGIVYRHKTWASCERRVKGVPQAKFKKLKGEGEMKTVLTSWGIPADVKVTSGD